MTARDRCSEGRQSGGEPHLVNYSCSHRLYRNYSCSHRLYRNSDNITDNVRDHSKLVSQTKVSRITGSAFSVFLSTQELRQL